MSTLPTRLLLIFAVGALCALASAAEPAAPVAETKPEGTVAISADGGTLGVGATLWFSVNDAFTVSAGYNGLGYNRDVTTNDVNYTGKLKLSNVPVLLNWHPFKGTFRVVGGVVFAGNKVDVVGQPNAGTTYTINNTTYTAAQVGSLKGTAKYENSTAPYLGIGWSKSPKRKGFGAFVDLGVMFSGSPKVAMVASGPISTDATFKANLASEVTKVNDEISAASVYPVARIGIMYRF